MVANGPLRAYQSIDYSNEISRTRRCTHVDEVLQQQLLEGDNDAWVVFLGIVEDGDSIGETAEPAKANAQKTSTGRFGTRADSNPSAPA